MSMMNRLDWSRQVAALNERIKTFQTDPGKEQFDAAIAAMREYAEAVQTGGIEVPQLFNAS